MCETCHWLTNELNLHKWKSPLWDAIYEELEVHKTMYHTENHNTILALEGTGETSPDSLVTK